MGGYLVYSKGDLALLLIPEPLDLASVFEATSGSIEASVRGTGMCALMGCHCTKLARMARMMGIKTLETAER